MRFVGVRIVMFVDPLQHGRDAFQPHPRINAGTRQIDARFRIQLLILHEHKIPDFNESVAIFIGGARGTSWNMRAMIIEDFRTGATWTRIRSEEHTSELQSLMRISYAVFCLKKKKIKKQNQNKHK